MYVYVIMPIFIVLFGYLEKKNDLAIKKNYTNSVLPRTESRRNLFYIFLVLTFLIVGGFRYKVGTDYGAYYRLYQTDLTDLLLRFRTLDEPGIYLITFLCRLVWNEGLFVIFIENAIVTFLVFKGIKSYKLTNITVPLLMYIFYCGWTFSFNGVRQAIAMSIIFAFSKQDGKRWVIKYIAIVFMAFLFHKSALFMFPILILAHTEISFRQFISIVIFTVLIPYLGEYAVQYMGLSITSADVYFTNDINPIRVIVAFVPLVLVIFLYIKKQNVFFQKNYFIVNMIIMNAILTYVTANSAYMNRFARFTSMYIMIFIPYFADRLTVRSRRIFNVVSIGLYFVMFLIEIQNSGNLIPFQWCFGHFGEY